VKSVTDAGRAALEMIRRARNLDDPQKPAGVDDEPIRFFLPENGR